MNKEILILQLELLRQKLTTFDVLYKYGKNHSCLEIIEEVYDEMKDIQDMLKQSSNYKNITEIKGH